MFASSASGKAQELQLHSGGILEPVSHMVEGQTP